MANRIVKIKDICHVVKGGIGITKAIPGNYPMVTLAEERKTHNEFQFDCKAVIIPLVSSTGHGHASMKRIHFQEGKFALGSILCALVPKNENEFVPEYLYHILDMGKERIFVPLMKGMANVSLPINRIKDVEINLPPYEEQIKLAEIYQEVSKNIEFLQIETQTQKDYIPKLRQRILQLAAEGNITQKWRELNSDIEPASILFEKIKAKKEQLINEGQIKKQQVLPAIFKDEYLFEIPDNWIWVRLNDIFNFIDYRGKTPHKIEKGVRLITAKNVRFGHIQKSPEEFISKAEYNGRMTRGFPKYGDILFTTEAPLGNAGILNINENDISTGQRLITFQSYYNLVDNECFLSFLLSPSMQNQILKNSSGVTAKGIKATKLKNIIIPLPPVDEQNAIVSKVKQLMSWCDELEKKIEKRDAYQDKMMQAVVKQAFKTENETIETD